MSVSNHASSGQAEDDIQGSNTALRVILNRTASVQINNNNNDACQPGLGACGASLSSPGRLVLNDLIGAGNRQMVNVRQDAFRQ